MPVEIRELVIKTTISGAGANKQQAVSNSEMKLMKAQLLEECRKMISVSKKKRVFNR